MPCGWQPLLPQDPAWLLFRDRPDSVGTVNNSVSTGCVKGQSWQFRQIDKMTKPKPELTDELLVEILIFIISYRKLMRKAPTTPVLAKRFGGRSGNALYWYNKLESLGWVELQKGDLTATRVTKTGMIQVHQYESDRRALFQAAMEQVFREAPLMYVIIDHAGIVQAFRGVLALMAGIGPYDVEGLRYEELESYFSGCTADIDRAWRGQSTTRRAMLTDIPCVLHVRQTVDGRKRPLAVTMIATLPPDIATQLDDWRY